MVDSQTRFSGVLQPAERRESRDYGGVLALSSAIPYFKERSKLLKAKKFLETQSTFSYHIDENKGEPDEKEALRGRRGR